MKFLFIPISLLFDFITSVRNFLFDYNILKAEKFDIPIICVGNLSLGGTGKTPHVNYIIKELSKMFNVAVISRGYKRNNKNLLFVDYNSNVLEVGDEPLMLKKKNPDTIILVSGDRAKGIKKIINEYPKIDVILLDDGFQHRWVRSGFNLLLTSVSNPFYKDYLFPFGSLRESKKGYKRADTIIVTNNPEKLDNSYIKKIESEFAISDKPIIFSKVKYQKPKHLFSDKVLDNLKERSIILLTGIANPTPLINYSNKNSTLNYHIKFKDHHNYTINDIKNILSYYNRVKDVKKLILTTEKDSVKLLQFNKELTGLEIYFIPIEIEVNNKENFDKKLIEYVSTN